LLLPDPTIDETEVASLVDREFGLGRAAVEFVPVGGDSWCYRAGPWWISVRRDRRGHHAAAYEAMRAFADNGCRLFLAPSRGRSGRVVHRVGSRPAVVFPYLELRAPADEPSAVSRAVDALHGLTVPPLISARLPCEQYNLFYVDELEGALARAQTGASDAGPFAARTVELLLANAKVIAVLRAEMDECRAVCVGLGDDGFVLTHGEPDGAVVVTADGRELLGDGGEIAFGPPERDGARLRMLGLDPPGREPVFRFFELLWILGEIAEYAARFTLPHPGNAEDEEKWPELLWYLEESPS